MVLRRSYQVSGGTHASPRRALATPPETPLASRRRNAAPPRSAIGWWFALFGVLAIGFAVEGCRSSSSGKPLRRARQRVFVLGFDGMDPTLARKWMDEGKLPNLKRLSEQGT